MAEIKKYHFSPDFRKEPKTNRYCANCQRDLKPGADIMHVSIDWDTWELWPDNNGEYKLGMDCWRQIKKINE